MSIIYICSRYRANKKDMFNQQLDKTKEIAREIILSGDDVIVPHLMITQFLKDDINAERDAGIKSALRLLDVCDFLYVYNGFGISSGMKTEIEYAKSKDMAIVYFKSIEELKTIIQARVFPKDRQFIAITKKGNYVVIWSGADESFFKADVKATLYDGKFNNKYFDTEYIGVDEILEWREL